MKNKRKLSLLGLAITSMVLCGCGDKKEADENKPADDITVTTSEAATIELPAKVTDKITGIELNKKTVSLFYNDKNDDSKFNENTTFKATVYPLKDGKRNIKWTSSDPTVATVDDNGKVTAVGQGTAEITVSNEDGTVKDSAHVVVNNMNGQRVATCKTRLTDILNTQKSEGFNMPETYSENKYLTNVVTKNGKVIRQKQYFESITVSEKNAYLDLTANSQEYRVENGSPVPDKVKYTFYTTDQFETFLFKSSGKVKNYMSINQSYFMGQEKIEALKAVCDQFFVSGSAILTGVKEDVLSNGVGSYIKSNDYNKHFGRFDDDPGQIAFDLHEEGTQNADKEDEEDNGIPEGTNYTIKIYVRFLFENNVLSAKHVDQSYEYTIDGDKYVNTFEVDNWYKINEEIVLPKKDNYQKVDSVFDL